MALVEVFEQVRSDRESIHRPVECGWRYFTADGEIILQLDTYGSAERKFRGKVSQSLQLNREGARRLLDIINQAFPGL